MSRTPCPLGVIIESSPWCQWVGVRAWVTIEDDSMEVRTRQEVEYGMRKEGPSRVGSVKDRPLESNRIIRSF